jgi:hypothetical protein
MPVFSPNYRAYSFDYGLMPEDIEPKFAVYDATVPAAATRENPFILDISDLVQSNAIGEHIQSIILTSYIGGGRLCLVFGGTNISVNAYSAGVGVGDSGKIIFPYMSPRGTVQHKLFNTLGNPTPFQLVFCNIPLPPVGYSPNF